MSNILDDLRFLKRPPSPQERLHKAAEQAEAPLLWEGQARRSMQQVGLALGIVALLIGIVLSMALQLDAGAFENFWSALEHFIFPIALGVVLITLVLMERYRHSLYFGISQNTIWVVRPKTIEQYPLATIHKFELISLSGSHGTIRGLHVQDNSFTNTLDKRTVVELPQIPDAYNLYQHISDLHRVAIEAPDKALEP